jgi:excisionase family DNA binding protein
MTEPDALTLSIPEAGRRYFGISRAAAYAAADRGEIPTIRIGKLRRVPVRALEQMLDEVVQRMMLRQDQAKRWRNKGVC